MFHPAMILTFRSIKEETQQDRRGDQISGYTSRKTSRATSHCSGGWRCDHYKGMGRQVTEPFQASNSIRKPIAPAFLRLKFHRGPGYGGNRVLEAYRLFIMVSAQRWRQRRTAGMYIRTSICRGTNRYRSESESAKSLDIRDYSSFQMLMPGSDPQSLSELPLHRPRYFHGVSRTVFHP
jgi:hypothetical protein